MTLFAAFTGVNYDGDTLVGVYSDMSKAIKAASDAFNVFECQPDCAFVRTIGLNEEITSSALDTRFTVFEINC